MSSLGFTADGWRFSSSAPPAVLAERPEVAADLHERLRPHGGPDPDRLAAWLAGLGEPPGQEAVAP
jgi:hypothetical protein